MRWGQGADPLVGLPGDAAEGGMGRQRIQRHGEPTQPAGFRRVGCSFAEAWLRRVSGVPRSLGFVVAMLAVRAQQPASGQANLRSLLSWVTGMTDSGRPVRRQLPSVSARWRLCKGSRTRLVQPPSHGPEPPAPAGAAATGAFTATPSLRLVRSCTLHAGWPPPSRSRSVAARLR